MADELGPEGRVPSPLIRGELPERLVELMLCYAEAMRAAGPWLYGEVQVPLVQLRDLGGQLRGLQAATEAVIEEAQRVYRETQDQRAAAERVLGGV